MECNVSWIFSFFYWAAVSCCVFQVIPCATTEFCVDHGFTPNNGHRSPKAKAGEEYFPGTLIRYYCNKYFELRPPIPKQKCIVNGTSGCTWEPELPPKCVELAKCSKPVIAHSHYDKEVYHQGELLTVSCDNGYNLVKENVSICLETGYWSYLPSCEENYCLLPPSIENGFFDFYPSIYGDEEIPPKTMVLYTCSEGYQLEPYSQIQRICREGLWTGVDPKCVESGCEPPELTYGDYIPKKPHYDVQDTLTYICHGNHDITRTCQPDHRWSGMPCPEAITTVPQMPDTSSQLYCTRPLGGDNHLDIKCCNDDSMLSTTENAMDFAYCCPERGLVEFVCNEGYSIDGVSDQWICSSPGHWMAVVPNNFVQVSNPPKCLRNGTLVNPGAFTEDMLKPVLGTAAGVLIILSAAIVIAFCRPKLIDMKRRWRELREDEDELIIDGRRILLPSYEEAVTSRDRLSEQQSCPSSSTSSGNDSTGPPHSQQELRTQRDSSSSCSVPREQARPSCSSDEEMLVPEPTNNEVDHAGSLSRPQSVVLTAGTSADACVVINPPPSDRPTSDTSNKEGSSPDSFPVSHVPASCGSFSDLRADDDPMIDLGSDAETNLESIFPQAPRETASKTYIRPVMLDDGSHLLSYPLVSDENSSRDQRFMIHIDQHGTSDCNSKEILMQTEEDQTVSTTGNNARSRNEGEGSHLELQSSDQIRIVMSSQSEVSHQRLDEMGSTAV